MVINGKILDDYAAKRISDQRAGDSGYLMFGAAGGSG